MRAVVSGALVALTIATAAGAQTHEVSGYYRSNGTYVAPHQSANPGYGTPYGSASGYTNPSDHQVSGYSTSRGTYVQPYRATNPNSSSQDNYSTRGNTNPYTGAPGSKPPY